MKPEAQRIAIAEALGWTNIKPPHGYAPEPYGLPPHCSSESQDLPDYLYDLNAMQEVWETLSKPKKADFAVFLNRIRGLEYEICGWIDLIGAPADLRAEAFLKTIGKWVKE